MSALKAAGLKPVSRRHQPPFRNLLDTVIACCLPAVQACIAGVDGSLLHAVCFFIIVAVSIPIHVLHTATARVILIQHALPVLTTAPAGGPAVFTSLVPVIVAPMQCIVCTCSLSVWPEQVALSRDTARAAWQARWQDSWVSWVRQRSFGGLEAVSNMCWPLS